jgi:hypothetical protein
MEHDLASSPEFEPSWDIIPERGLHKQKSSVAAAVNR